MNFSIRPELLYQIINEDAYLIDIRDSHQFNKLHIKNFTNLTKEEFYKSLPNFSKRKPIYLMCYQGTSTQSMIANLRAMNYQAYYIEGGFQAFLNLTNTQYF